MIKNYVARGLVYGNYWGGGRGSYKSETIRAKTLKTLLKTAKIMLESGALDSGMGYESLVGAIFNVEKIETIEKNGKKYQRSEHNIEIIGDLKEQEWEFLIDNL